MYLPEAINGLSKQSPKIRINRQSKQRPIWVWKELKQDLEGVSICEPHTYNETTRDLHCICMGVYPHFSSHASHRHKHTCFRCCWIKPSQKVRNLIGGLGNHFCVAVLWSSGSLHSETCTPKQFIKQIKEISGWRLHRHDKRTEWLGTRVWPHNSYANEVVEAFSCPEWKLFLLALFHTIVHRSGFSARVTSIAVVDSLQDLLATEAAS